MEEEKYVYIRKVWKNGGFRIPSYLYKLWGKKPRYVKLTVMSDGKAVLERVGV